MGYILDGLGRAIRLITHLDPEILAVVWLSLKVSFLSTLTAAVFAVPLGLALGFCQFPGKSLVVSLLNTLLSIPTVVVGLVGYSFLSRRGPLGFLGLLFTWKAIVFGQVFVVFPLVTALTVNAAQTIDRQVLFTLRSLGASRWQAARSLVREARFAVMGAVIAGFGRVVGEVGVSMMLGGNIRGATRTMTTAIALETSKGEFAFGLALGIVLLCVTFIINAGLHYFQRGGRP